MKSIMLALLLPVVAALAADAPAKFEVGSLSFKTPEKWESVRPMSSMRKAQLRVPGDAGAGEVIFFHFGPGDGGGTQSNIERWLNQFKDAQDKKVTDEKVGGRKVIYV